MPFISWLVLAWLSGLLAGFGGRASIAGVAGGVCVVIALLRHEPRFTTAGVFIVAGACTAAVASRDRRSCVVTTTRANDFVAVVASAVEPGGFSRAVTVGCSAPVTLFVASGRAAAGSSARVRGQITSSADGMSVLVQAASIRQITTPPWTASLRAAASRGTDRSFGSDAPLVRALVLADMNGMSPEIRDRWAAAGMAHMLSVSGLHVGIIALVVELLLGVERVKRQVSPVVALLIIVVYVLIIGAPPPAVRSAVMLGVRALCRLMQRSVSPWAFVALGGIQPMLDPWIVLDLGYQLSVIGVAALIVAGRLVKRMPIPRRPKWSREMATALVCTVVASIASSPLVAWSFGRISVVAPLSNLASGPIIAAVQPMLFLGVLLSPFPSAARFVADAAHPLLLTLNTIATVAANMPGAAITVWPSATTAAASAVITLCVLVACAHERPLRPLIAAATGIAILVWQPAPIGSSWTEIHMIDVGQGDAIALRTRGGHWVLFDAGRVWTGGDAGKRTVVPYIAHIGGSVSAFVLSHPHADHVGGAASVLDMLRPSRYFDAAFVAHSTPYAASLRSAKRRGVAWSRVHPGDSIVVDEASIVFLAPDSTFEASLPDPNNASTVALVRVGAIRFLFMGDAESEEEEWLLEHDSTALAADVLKVGHHGSSTSSTPRFLDAVRPRFALVSVGVANTYGHPSGAVMTDLAARGAQVLRTDQLGTIVLETDGRIVRVRQR